MALSTRPVLLSEPTRQLVFSLVLVEVLDSVFLLPLSDQCCLNDALM